MIVHSIIETDDRVSVLNGEDIIKGTALGYQNVANKRCLIVLWDDGVITYIDCLEPSLRKLPRE